MSANLSYHKSKKSQENMKTAKEFSFYMVYIVAVMNSVLLLKINSVPVYEFLYEVSQYAPGGKI